ncbi:hypothetical protein ROD_10441 [Citrobacter rodentium ICC168]|uniref:Uncharacterized protein n=1 Tax=Citrobacter rodentium (strain ICC168) TaxID=637910 RepID=D2TT09_CITRI|nr:hypothetical protein ROD_10441 [Citrobacter rodentium ICC168]
MPHRYSSPRYRTLHHLRLNESQIAPLTIQHFPDRFSPAKNLLAGVKMI